MALTMDNNVAPTQDTDLMDIDIDMDLGDGGAGIEEELQLEEGEEPSFVPAGTSLATNTNIIPAIYTEDPALEPQWSKLHIRGLDDFHTNDLLSLVHDHDPEASVSIQWVDDTSANILYQSKQQAFDSLLKLISQPTTSEAIENTPFELRTAKTLASRPGSMLMLRVAQVGDKKKRNAREASRYYLLHPEEDPTERMRKEFANGKRPRDGDSSDYRRRRFDDREHRRRRDHDQNGGDNTEFAASMYDDAPSQEPRKNGRERDLFSRVTRARSASPGRRTINSDEIEISDSDDDGRQYNRRRSAYRDRSERPPPYTRRDPAPFPKDNAGKELFASDSNTGGGLRSDRMEFHDSFSSRTQTVNTDNRANTAAAKRLKADLLSAAQTSPRSNHRRSHALDARNDEDLAERFARKSSLSIDSTNSIKGGNTGVELFPSSNSNGISIKGAADQGMSIRGSGGFSIKGRALEVKELFPDRYQGGGTGNEGKELFDEPVREKRVRRRAGDLFD